jgi:hypothetical protein
MLRDIFPRIALQLLNPDAVAVDFGFDVAVGGTGEAVKVNLNQPMSEILALLSQYPVSTRLSLSGTIIGVTVRRLGRAGVVDRVIFDVLRQGFAIINKLFQLISRTPS